ncbi:MAG TPA: VOC family protein [Candidatus Acidoferrales bacterium]|nr:VOC family protein [Candidatus Acidoferrales bacterium]
MSEKEASREAATTFGGVNPIFRVQSLKASIEHYVKVLGFKVDWETPYVASVSRGRCGIFLSEGDQGNPPAWVWIGAGDVEVLLEEYRATGAKVRHPPTNYQWAYEMQIEDLDGNVLRIGSEPKEDQPFGEWLDMYGHRWVTKPGGGATRVED